ncbi:hypothetical protein ACHAXN_009693 [Cyclotella atomus]
MEYQQCNFDHRDKCLQHDLLDRPQYRLVASPTNNPAVVNHSFSVMALGEVGLFVVGADVGDGVDISMETLYLCIVAMGEKVGFDVGIGVIGDAEGEFDGWDAG